MTVARVVEFQDVVKIEETEEGRRGEEKTLGRVQLRSETGEIILVPKPSSKFYTIPRFKTISQREKIDVNVYR